MILRILYFLIAFIIISILNFTFNPIDLFNILMVFTLYVIYVTSFSHIRYKKNSNLLSVILSMFFISIIYLIINYLISKFLLTNILMPLIISSLLVFVIPSIKLILDYLLINKQIKKRRLCYLIIFIIPMISFILDIVLFNIKVIDINLFILIILGSLFISFILIIFFNKSMFNLKNISIPIIKSVLTNDIKSSIIKLSNIFYYNFSIIVLYYYLTNKYLYNNLDVSSLIINTYICCYYIVVVFIFIFYPKKIEDNINLTIIKLIKKILPYTILTSIVAGPILLLLFNDNSNSSIFTILIFESMFIIMYNIIIGYLKDKKCFELSIIIGLLCKMIITIPLINSLYRMGYSMVVGNIFSTIISLLIVIMIGIIHFNNKNRLEFGNYFEYILEIVYENIILCLILVLLQLVFPLSSINKIESIYLIFIYVSIFLVFRFIKSKLRRRV